MYLGDIPLFIDDGGEFGFTLETESLAEDLEFTLAGLGCHHAVDFLVLSIHNQEVPFLNRPQNNHLVDICLQTRMIELFAKMLTNLNRNIGKWYAQSQ